VWGSWYDTSNGTWGYACCHSSIHISYCSGLAGIQAAQASTAQQLLASSTVPPSQEKIETDERAERVERIDQNYSKKRIGEGDFKLDQDKLAQAVLDEKKRKSRGMKDEDDRSSKKQKSGLESGSHEVTEEELGIISRVFFVPAFLTYLYRGLPDEPTDDRRSHG
jgi:pre-mRNA-processing factor SLU7